MALKDEFESAGNWLFRWRSYLPVGLIVLFLLVMYEYKHTAHSQEFDVLREYVCFTVCFLGLVIRIFTIGHTPKGTSGRNTKTQRAEELNTKGMYSMVRHPLYLGNFFMGLGISIYPLLWWLVVIYVLAFWLYYERIMFAEEAFLTKKYGEKYLKWADVTPAFIPNLRTYEKPGLPFSFKNVLKREYNGFFAVIVVLFLFKMTTDFVAGYKLVINLHWAINLSVGFSVWVILRFLRKNTKVLNVEGR